MRFWPSCELEAHKERHECRRFLIRNGTERRPPRVAEAGPLVFLIAGEPSGDRLGAGLMSALKQETAGRVRFVGIGGARMAAEGLDSLFPMDELSVMGLVEVLPLRRKEDCRMDTVFWTSV